MEQPLDGGNMTAGVVRVGETVRRPRGARSEFAAKAVTWLNDHEFPYAAQYLGMDADGRDVFEYVDGTTTEHPAQRDERSYAAMGSILRELHALTAGSDIAGGGAVLVHGDPGPFNVICRDGMPVALIDWDSAHGGDPCSDVGYAAWTWCTGDIDGIAPSHQAVRLRAFRDAYDPAMSPAQILGAIFRAQQSLIAGESTVRADSRQSPARREHADRAVRWARKDCEHLARNLDVFRSVLADRKTS